MRVLLHGACVGTMADVAGKRTCLDTEGPLVAPEAPLLDPNKEMSRSQQGTFGSPGPCTATPRPGSKAADGSPLYDEEVCVPGSLLAIGSQDGSLRPQVLRLDSTGRSREERPKRHHGWHA